MVIFITKSIDSKNSYHYSLIEGINEEDIVDKFNRRYKNYKLLDIK